jgi:hypothetical protein
MLIEQIKPDLVGGKSDLESCLRAESRRRGWPDQDCEAIISIVPQELLSCGCFLDRLTGLWRYEFGEPHRIGTELIWGIHMWSPVPVLLDVLACAHLRLPSDRLAAYLRLLVADARRHQEYLAEMFPMLHVEAAIPAQYEVAGHGVGNKTIDWVIGPAEGRTVKIDVKRRYKDFLAQMEGVSEGDIPPPAHDPALLFRSVEEKFREEDPQSSLQGAWIVTDIQQEEDELERAFTGLDASKVHFAVLGDAQSDVGLLTRREEDRAFILRLFGAVETRRFQFKRAC